jgi:hypothetical protein
VPNGQFGVLTFAAELELDDCRAVAIAADPSLWREQVARWAERGWRVVERPKLVISGAGRSAAVTASIPHQSSGHL